jgi:hypothetical protein
MLNHAYLRRILHYSIITGDFHRLEATSSRANVGNDASNLYRKLDVNTTEVSYFAKRTCDTSDNYEYVVSNASNTLLEYVPKHIKDLENLKRGDVVWVKSTEYDNKEQWAMARYISHDGYDYLVSNLYDANGKSLRHFCHKEVFLKPPFDF